MRFIFLYFLLFTNSYAENSNQATAPKYKIGDNWSFQSTELFKNVVNPMVAKIEVTSIINDRISFRGTGFDSKLWAYTTDLNTNIPYLFQGENLLNKQYEWPLFVGKKWNNDRKYAGVNVDLDTRQVCEVQSLEKIKVPAGEFDAFKIFCKLRQEVGENLQTSETYRWYSAVAKANVKTQFKWWIGTRLDSQSVRELTHYHVE